MNVTVELMIQPRFGGHKDKIVREAARILHNFDIPKGLVREGESRQDLRSSRTPT
jgi:hypothetical protein